MDIVRHRKIFYLISGLLFTGSIISFALWGLKPGIDFTGGSLMELEYVQSRPNLDGISKIFQDAGIAARVQGVGERGVIARFRPIEEVEHRAVLQSLAQGAENPASVFTEKRFDSIGPAIGDELKKTSFQALFLVLIAICLYVAWAFRKVSAPVSSWKYGIVTLVALMHDVFIPAGVFAVLGKYAGVEVDTLFITGLLTILGFSVHDTIVVFDRIREKLRTVRGSMAFAELVSESIRETFARSVNTSLTTAIVLGAIFIFGGESTKYFSLLLLIGIIAGTYSSIFIASPLLVSWHEWDKKRA